MSGAARPWPYAAVAAVAALPFLRGPLAGQPLYFRDLALHFLPLRRFVLEGLARGELRFWNPYAHEGEPLALPPIAYPFELLALLRPDEAGVSFLLALHVPLAAVWMMAFARHALGLSAPGAAAGALVYALGGFALSTLNLYVYAHALAWAPAAMLGLHLAARGGRAQVALAALAIGVLVSTTAAEMAAQAILVGVVLALPAGGRGLGRMAAAVVLGAGLAAPVAGVVAHVAGDSARAAGFPAEVVLAHSIHPLTLVQTVAAGFHGDTARLADRWWGGNFFPRGFPYFLSLYLGLAALAAAAVGALEGQRLRLRLAVVCALGVALALGRWGDRGLDRRRGGGGAPLPLPIQGVFRRAPRRRAAVRARGRGAGAGRGAGLAAPGRDRARRRPRRRQRAAVAPPGTGVGAVVRRRLLPARHGARRANGPARLGPARRRRRRGGGGLRRRARPPRRARTRGARLRRRRRDRAGGRGPAAGRRRAQPRRRTLVLRRVAGDRPPSRRVAVRRPGVLLRSGVPAARTRWGARCAASTSGGRSRSCATPSSRRST